jgi:uncharacterized protein (DUF1800 family)
VPRGPGRGPGRGPERQGYNPGRTMTLPVQNDLSSATHLLNRAAWGPRPGQAQELAKQGLETWIKEQVAPKPDPALDRMLGAYPSLQYTTGQILDIHHAENEGPERILKVLDEFYTAKLVRAAHAKNQLLEVMVDFWFNHFNVNLQKLFVRQSVMSYERDALRPFALGRFRDILGATAAHPAMLFYLDNYLSKKTQLVDGLAVPGLNENFGRELLELHTVGVDAGYTQAHVIDAARVLTGWSIDDLRKGNFVFKAEDHDDGAKEVFGLAFPAGGGREEGLRLLDYLAVHPATARFISRKLARRFVSDDPPESLIQSCAQSFLASGGDMARVMTTLLTSPEFWAQRGQPKLKTPVEYVFSAVRAAGGKVESAVGATRYLARLGMQPYFCTPPTGYSSRGADWVSPLYLHRMNFALDLAAGKVAGITVGSKAIVRRGGGNPDDAASAAAVLNREIFAGGLSSTTLAAVAAVDGASGGVGIAEKTVGLLLASPEMQVR